MDKYKPNERPQSKKPSKFKTVIAPKRSNFSIVPRKKTSFLEPKISPNESPNLKDDFIPDMHSNKTASIKQKLKEDLIAFEEEERRYPGTAKLNERKTAPHFIKDRKSMPPQAILILKDIDLDINGERKIEDEENHLIDEKTQQKSKENSNGSSDSLSSLSMISNGREDEFVKGYYSDSYLYKKSASNSDKIHE